MAASAAVGSPLLPPPSFCAWPSVTGSSCRACTRRHITISCTNDAAGCTASGHSHFLPPLGTKHLLSPLGTRHRLSPCHPSRTAGAHLSLDTLLLPQTRCISAPPPPPLSRPTVPTERLVSSPPPPPQPPPTHPLGCPHHEIQWPLPGHVIEPRPVPHGGAQADGGQVVVGGYGAQDVLRGGVEGPTLGVARRVARHHLWGTAARRSTAVKQ